MIETATAASSAASFPATTPISRRLDRDHDQALSAADFDFSGSALASSPGAMLFMRADTDGNGKVTREELERFLENRRYRRQGFLSLSDLQEAFSPPPVRPSSPSSGRPSKATLVRGLFTQEIGSLEPGPKVDDSAPDFTLKTNDGKSEITLSKLVGPEARRARLRQFHLRAVPQPVGQHRKALPPLQGPRDVRDGLRAARRTRPTAGAWKATTGSARSPRSRKRTTSASPWPRNAAGCCPSAFPMLVDTIDDAAGARYSGMPGRLYVIDREGKVAFKSGRGPYLFKPAEMEQSLVLLLQDEGAIRARKRRSRYEAS